MIHIHEDDWGMRSLHPMAAWAEVSTEVAKAAEAGERNRAADGVGWTAVHVIREPAFDFTRTDLSLPPLARQLELIMPRVRQFYATASAGFDRSQRDPCGSYDEDAWCFGLDADCFIKLEPASDRISRIWFEARGTDPARLDAVRRAIRTVDTACEACIVDYWADAAGRVRDPAFMERYFRWLGDADAN